MANFIDVPAEKLLEELSNQTEEVKERLEFWKQETNAVEAPAELFTGKCSGTGKNKRYWWSNPHWASLKGAKPSIEGETRSSSKIARFVAQRNYEKIKKGEARVMYI